MLTPAGCLHVGATKILLTFVKNNLEITTTADKQISHAADLGRGARLQVTATVVTGRVADSEGIVGNMRSVVPRPLEMEQMEQVLVILCLKIQSFPLKVRKIPSYILKTECISS